MDGVDITSILPQELRSRITVIPQDPIELPGSVRFNLRPWNFDSASVENDHALIQEALETVELWEHVSTNGGLDADFASLPLSQGQKQLFCLSRAILHHRSTNSKIVLADEATSSVDLKTDRRMQSIIRKAFAGCTMVVVAHRTETIRDADLIVRLESGRLEIV